MINGKCKKNVHNLFGELSTLGMQSDLLNAHDIDEYLEKNRHAMIPESFSDYLNMLLYEKNIDIADVVRRSNLDKTYTYQIFSGKKKNPSRDKLIAIAFGLDLNLDETRKMLKASGNNELYAKNVRDSIIMFAMNNHMNIIETNELLSEKGHKIIE